MLRAVSEDPGHISRICLSVLRSGYAFRGDTASDIAACQAIFCNLRTVGPPGAPFELRRSLLALRFSRLSAARDHSFAQISTLNSRIWQSFLHAASRRRTCAVSGALDQSRTRRKPQGALAERRRGQRLQRLRDTCASTIVVLGSAAYTSRKPRAVCGSVTNIPARAVLAGMRAQSPVRCDGLARRMHAAPARNSGLALVPGRPQRAWPAATQLQLQLRTARPTERCAGPRAGQWADSLGPPAARGPWRSWMLAAGPPSAVTEVGCQWPSRWRRLSTARGRFPEMQKWAQVAEESGSRVWARPREACDVTPSQWRTRHTRATPHLASPNKRASRSKVSQR